MLGEQVSISLSPVRRAIASLKSTQALSQLAEVPNKVCTKEFQRRNIEAIDKHTDGIRLGIRNQIKKII
jgi:hypothetical protein